MTTALGTGPIPGASPTGANVRYEPEFEKLQAEIAKMENPAADAIRWPDVVSLSEAILSQKAKDMLVGAYYAFGRLQLHGYQGLAEGLATLNGMCASFWDGLFPELKRMQARENAIDWLIDRVQAFLETAQPPSSDDAGHLLLGSKVVDALDAFLRGKTESPNPKVAALSRALAAKASQGGSAAGAAASGDSSASTTTSAPGGAVSTGPIGSRKQAFERLKEVADYLRRTEPHSPVSYLVNRAVKWGDMRLEDVLTELVKNSDVREHLFETLGVKAEKKAE